MVYFMPLDECIEDNTVKTSGSDQKEQKITNLNRKFRLDDEAKLVNGMHRAQE
jgi:hypothetical protein